MKNQKTKTQNRWKASFFLILTILSLVGCQKAYTDIDISDLPSETETTAVSTGNVREYVFEQDESRVYIVKNGDEKNDITSFVTNIIQGDLYLSPDGIRYLFDLGLRDTTEEERELFTAKLKENNFAVTEGSFLCLSSSAHTLVFQDGSKLYLLDGNDRMLDSPCIKVDNHRFSIPVIDLVFAFGYDSMSSSLDGKDIIYTLIKN